MFDQGFEDRVLIREVYGRYAIAVARKDGAEWLQCWSTDATWKTPHFEVAGRPALEQMWGATWTDFENVAAFNEVGPITISGNKASALSTVLEIVTLKAGGFLKMTGLYTDQFTREDGEWRFAYREYTAIGQEVSASAPPA